ncbi:hypothetical protein V8G54_021864 [Vigna mungo]|uniref:Uncharacterized protein n=1 Tax=Vigna mungo TaxID=3915 RepID=A0AAQ3NGX1_VIGMU
MKFEDFLGPNLNGDEMLSVFSEGNMVSFSSGGIWVPQAAPSSGAYWEQMGEQNGYKEGRKDESSEQRFKEIQVSLVEIRVRVASCDLHNNQVAIEVEIGNGQAPKTESSLDHLH